jgi:hypothetical protein
VHVCSDFKNLIGRTFLSGNDIFAETRKSPLSIRGLKPRTEIPNQVRDDKKRDPNPVVMLTLELMKIRLVSASG